MRTQTITDNETAKEIQPGEQTLVFDFDFNSDLGKYLIEIDTELRKKYVYGPLDNENI